MKTILKFTLGIFSVFFLFLSCSDTEDSDLFLGKEHIIQNEGYLPLAPSNFWLYETYVGEENNGVIEYKDVNEFNEEERFVVKSNRLTGKENDGETIPFISYEFSPIADKGLIGGLLGNFYQVVKDTETGEYRRTEFSSLKVLQEEDGEVKTKTVLKLSDTPFLLDTVTNDDVGARLFYERKTIDLQVGIPATIVYERYTEIVGKYDKIPLEMASTPGVDDHLLQFSDIVHVRDYLRIVEISAEIKTINVNVDVQATLNDEGKSTAFLNSVSTSAGDGIGSVWLESDVLGGIPGIGGIPLLYMLSTILYSSGKLRIATSDFDESLEFCKSMIDYKVRSKMNVPINLIFSDDVPYYQDTYYARNVGIIKTVTNNRQMKGNMEINPNLAALNLGNIVLKPTDPNCTVVGPVIGQDANGNPTYSNVNRAQISLEIDPQIESFQSRSPMVMGEPAVKVANLRKYYIRKSF